MLNWMPILPYPFLLPNFLFHTVTITGVFCPVGIWRYLNTCAHRRLFVLKTVAVETRTKWRM